MKQTACDATIAACLNSGTFMLGTRDCAEPLRAFVENELGAGKTSVCIDFAGLMVTPSFMDEFLGVLVTRHGPSVLERIVLRNCSDEVRAAAQFVAEVRMKPFIQSHVTA
jgi:STAS-like domain of unknown function (DUF4325)